MTPVQTSTIVATRSCPLCHTVDPEITSDGARVDSAWTCTRCGQTWNAGRIAAVAAYATYAAAY